MSRIGTNAGEAERLRRLVETATALSARGVLFVTAAEAFHAGTKARIRAAFRDPAWRGALFLEGFSAGAAEE